MARVMVSSAALFQAVRKVDSFRTVTLVARGGALEIHSTYNQDKIPSEYGNNGIEAKVLAARLQEVLKGITEQPITLDLHDGMPSKLFAGRYVGDVYDMGRKWEPLEFEL